MRRLLWIGFLVGLATLAIGFGLIQAAAISAGSWWQARQPLIGLGLDAFVVGLAIVHVTAPPFILASIAPRPARGVAAFAVLLTAVAIAIAISSVRGVPLMAYAALFMGGVAGAWILVAWRRPALRAAAAALVVVVVGATSAMAALWWLLLAMGGWLLIHTAPGSQRPPPSLADAGTLIYSAPELAMLWLGPPTIALAVLALAISLVSRQPRAASAQPPVDEPAVLT